MKVKVINKSKNDLPKYATDGAAALDIMADFSDLQTLIGIPLPEYHENSDNTVSATIFPGKRALVNTKLFVEVPVGYELQIRPRSGLALKHGIMVVNSPGTIDSDYRGEVGVILMNMGSEPFTIKQGDRIAQAVLSKCEKIEWNTGELSKTERGEGGFGSSGVGARPADLKVKGEPTAEFHELVSRDEAGPFAGSSVAGQTTTVEDVNESIAKTFGKQGNTKKKK